MHARDAGRGFASWSSIPLRGSVSLRRLKIEHGAEHTRNPIQRSWLKRTPRSDIGQRRIAHGRVGRLNNFDGTQVALCIDDSNQNNHALYVLLLCNRRRILSGEKGGGSEASRRWRPGCQLGREYVVVGRGQLIQSNDVHLQQIVVIDGELQLSPDDAILKHTGLTVGGGHKMDKAL